MKTIFRFSLILIGSFLSFSTLVQAQDNVAPEEDGHIFVIVTFEVLRPVDGRRAERDSIVDLYYEHVIAKNDLIISEKNLRHLYGSNSGDWVIVTEYANWNDVEVAGEKNDELFMEKWATEEERQAFNKVFWKYFGEHKDEIYLADPRFAK